MDGVTRIVILGGGPGGYEAALVAVQLGAEVVLIERDGIGGACVLADCVPSKTLIATSESVTALEGSERLGLRPRDGGAASEHLIVDASTVYRRVKALATAQSADITRLVSSAGVRVIHGTGCFTGGASLPCSSAHSTAITRPGSIPSARAPASTGQIGLAETTWISNPASRNWSSSVRT